MLYDGQNLNDNKGKITNFKFSKSDFGLADMDSHLVVQKKMQEQSTTSLFDCLHNIYYNPDLNLRLINCDLSNPRNIFKELFKRLIVPLYIPVLILISLLLILKSKENVQYLRYKFLTFIRKITFGLKTPIVLHFFITF